MKNFRVFFIIVIIALIIGSCSKPAQVAQETQAPVKLRINGTTNISNAPIYMADELGYFTEQNLEIEYVPFEKSTEALALLASGDLDVYGGGTGSAIFTAMASDENIKIVADKGNLGTSDCSYNSILIRKALYDSGEITKPSQFKGRKMECNPVGTSGYIASKFLLTGGLDIKDIEVMSLPGASIPDAFATGALDAISEVEPDLSMILKAGNTRLWAAGNEILPGFQSGFIAFGKKLVKNQPDVGLRFMIAYLKAVKKYDEGKTPDNLAIITKFSEQPLDVLNIVCMPTINVDGHINSDTLDEFQQWSLERELIEKIIPQEQYWYPYFVEKAYAELNK